MPLEIRGAHFLIRSAQLVLRIGADMPAASAWRSTLLAGSAVLFVFVCTSRLSRTACMDGQHQDVDRTLRAEESIRMTEDRDEWRKYVHGVANPRIEDG